MRHPHSLMAALATIGSIVACKPVRSPHDEPAARAAAALVERFVAADTSDNAEAAAALVLPLGNGIAYCELGTDGYNIASSVTLTDTIARRDTVWVVAKYEVLGTWWSEDSHHVGLNSARFRADPHPELDTFVVVRDSTGRLGISCDHHVPPNHPSPAHWSTVDTHFDSASLAAWNSVMPPSTRK